MAHGEVAPGITLAQFIAPGIVIFSMIHSAFESAAAYIVYDKLDGMIGDILSAPLKPFEIAAGYALAAATSALSTGAVVLVLMAIFVDLPLHSLAAVIGFAVAGALLFALLGTILGLWADRWENYSAAETFLILPLGLLSGRVLHVGRRARGRPLGLRDQPRFPYRERVPLRLHRPCRGCGPGRRRGIGCPQSGVGAGCLAPVRGRIQDQAVRN